MFSKSYFDKKCNFHFCRFLQYCIENKSNIGCNFEEEEDELEDSIQKLDQVKITASLGKKIYPNMEVPNSIKNIFRELSEFGTAGPNDNHLIL